MTAFLAIMSLYFGFVLNTPVTSKLIELTKGSESHLFSYTSPLLLSFAFFIIFSAFGFKFVFRPVFILFTISSAAACYATNTYQVIFDYGMIENIFETHSSEAASYVNMRSVMYVFFTGIVPSILIALVKIDTDKPLKTRMIHRAVGLVVAVVGIAALAALFYKDYASVGRNNKYLNKMIVPTHIYYSTRYIKNTVFPKEQLPFKELGEDAKMLSASNGKPTLFVLVVGETARSQNFAYNGYERDTNKYTKGEGIISFQDVSSCGTATAHSLPCMFSNMDRDGYKKDVANNQSNALDIISKADVSISWYENDGGDKAVAKRLELIQIDPSSDKQLCDGLTCYDEVMLKGFDDKVLSSEGNKMIAFHTIGSHGPTYYKRYPSSMTQFTPSCDRSDIENCTDEEIVNVYDNTIAYTDYFLSQVINKLKSYQDKYNVAMLYLSDHGESLGENGLYLHGTPYVLAPEEQTKVPLLLWMGEGYAEAKGIDEACLREKAASNSYSHDNFFHSLIDFFGVETKDISPEKSFISECRI
ncbi:phosphoethanolamine--lipid A transferase [Vibrio cholerae]|nr:phosphoethanolamine--lipid A transferase [Vibrio parahaemolyticus]TVM95421.1 phosphoethanolamine--lipid A transferase [Vibrio cholerae]